MSKPPAPENLPWPHVAILSTPSTLVDESRRVLLTLQLAGHAPEQVEATFDPADSSAIILVRWPEPRR